MSDEALRWAHDQTSLKFPIKVVLMAIAYLEDDPARRHANKTMASQIHDLTGMSRKRVYVGLSRLQSLGLIQLRPRQPGRQRSFYVTCQGGATR